MSNNQNRSLHQNQSCPVRESNSRTPSHRRTRRATVCDDGQSFSRNGSKSNRQRFEHRTQDDQNIAYDVDTTQNLFQEKSFEASQLQLPFTFSNLANNPLALIRTVPRISLPSQPQNAIPASEEVQTIQITSNVKRLTNIAPGIKSFEESSRSQNIELSFPASVPGTYNTNPSIALVLRSNDQDRTFDLNFDNDTQSLRVLSDRDALDITTGNQTVSIQPNETVNVDTLHGTITFDDGNQNSFGQNTTSQRRRSRSQGPQTRPNFIRRLNFDNTTRLNSTMQTGCGFSDVLGEIDDKHPVVCYQNNRVVHVMYPDDYEGPKINVVSNDTAQSTTQEYSRLTPPALSSQGHAEQNKNETTRNNNISRSRQNNTTFVRPPINNQTVNLTSESIAPPQSSQQFVPLFASSANNRSHFPEIFSGRKGESNFKDMLQDSSGHNFTGATETRIEQSTINDTHLPRSRINNQTVNITSQSISAPTSSKQFQPLFASSVHRRSHYPELFSTCDNESNFNDMLQETGNYFSGATQSDGEQFQFDDGTFAQLPVNNQTVDLTSQSIAAPTSPRQFVPLFASSALNRSYYPELFSTCVNESNMNDMFESDSYFDDHPTLDSTGSTVRSSRQRSRTIDDSTRDMSSFKNNTFGQASRSQRSDRMVCNSPQRAGNNATYIQSPLLREVPFDQARGNLMPQSPNRGDNTFNQTQVCHPSRSRSQGKSQFDHSKKFPMNNNAVFNRTCTRSVSQPPNKSRGFNSSNANQTVLLDDPTYNHSHHMYPQEISPNRTHASSSSQSPNRTHVRTPNQSPQRFIETHNRSNGSANVACPQPAVTPPQTTFDRSQHISTPKSSRIRLLSTSGTPILRNATPTNSRDPVTHHLQYTPQTTDLQQGPCTPKSSGKQQSPILIHNPVQCYHTGAPVKNHACRGAIPKTRKCVDVEEAEEAIELSPFVNTCLESRQQKPVQKLSGLFNRFRRNRVNPCDNNYR